MPLPDLDSNGNLPVGLFDATIEELSLRFSTNEHRQELMMALRSILALCRACGMVREIMLGGSFASTKPDPDDVDLLIIVNPLPSNPGAFEYRNHVTIIKRLSGFRPEIDAKVLPEGDHRIPRIKGLMELDQNNNRRGLIRISGVL